jgi:pilus assembly protein CpaB
MNRRAFLYLALSAICGLVGLAVYRAQLAMPAPSVSAGPMVVMTMPVVLASNDIDPGGHVDYEDLEVVEWPQDFMPLGTFASLEEVADRVTIRTISKGEPILVSALLAEGEIGGLQSLIEPNHRAMSVEVDAVVGVSGFIKPGSRVDVLAQLRTMNATGVVPHSRTILQNVKVLAIDQQYAGVDDMEAALASVVTLQVLPSEAQRLAYATAEGKLQLALRGRTDEAVVALRNTGPTDFLDPAPPTRRKVTRRAAPKPSIESIRGTNVGRDYL